MKLIDFSRETDCNNEICPRIRFALCVIKHLQFAPIEHYSPDVDHPLSFFTANHAVYLVVLSNHLSAIIQNLLKLVVMARFSSHQHSVRN